MVASGWAFGGFCFLLTEQDQTGSYGRGVWETLQGITLAPSATGLGDSWLEEASALTSWSSPRFNLPLFGGWPPNCVGQRMAPTKDDEKLP